MMAIEGEGAAQRAAAASAARANLYIVCARMRGANVLMQWKRS
tara:strand:- start:150 stop:278 length:129 start_codon:yes stop_codon:yes gene_type:complete